MKFVKDDIIMGKILFIIGLIFLIVTSYISFTKLGMWGDDLFTLWLIPHSISDIITISSQDVHPPLYYLIYKLISTLFIWLNISTNYVIIGRFTSMLPFYLLFILALTKIRKEFGWLVAGIFSLAIIGMPQMMNYAVDLRMYGWGLFFVITSFVFFYNILIEKNVVLSWIIVTILTICSVYTHYFSGMASGILYLILLIYFIRNNRLQIKYWLLSVFISIAAFSLWIPTLLNQIFTNNGSYWIEPMTIQRVIGFIFFICSPKNEIISSNEIASFSILGCLLFISVVILVILFLKEDYKDLAMKYAIFGILASLLVPIIGIVGSIVINPFIHPRYLIPSMGMLWLGISILLAKNFNKRQVFTIILVIILACSVFGCITFIDNQNAHEEVDNNLKLYLDEICGKDNFLLFDDVQINYLYVSYYLPNATYCPIDTNGNINSLYSQIEIFLDSQNEYNKSIYLFYVPDSYNGSEITLDHSTYYLKEVGRFKEHAIIYEVFKK